MRHRARTARFAPIVALFAILAFVVSACGSSAPALADPKEIITKGVTNLQSLKSFHIDVTLAGSLKIPTGGDASSATPFKLDGTSLTADIDVAKKSLQASGSLMGFTAQVLVAGTSAYVKLPAMLAGTDKWIKTPVTDSATATVTDPQKSLDEINKALDTQGVSPTKGADEKIGDQDCYKVTLTIPSKALQGAADSTGAADQLGGLSLTDIPVNMWVRKSDNRLTRMSMDVNLGEMGTVSVQVDMNKFDQPVTITEPAPDQVQEMPAGG